MMIKTSTWVSTTPHSPSPGLWYQRVTIRNFYDMTYPKARLSKVLVI